MPYCITSDSKGNCENCADSYYIDENSLCTSCDISCLRCKNKDYC